MKTTTLIFGCCIISSLTFANDDLALQSAVPVAALKTKPDSSADVPPVLVIDDAISAAMGNHPALRAIEAAVQRQQHLVYQATRGPNPVVGYMASEVGNDGDFGQQGVFLNQEIVRGCKLGLDGRIQQREVEVQRQQLLLQRMQIEARIRTAFLKVAYYQEQLRLQITLQKSLDIAVKAVRSLVESGELGTSALLQSSLESQRNQMLTRRSETQLNAAQSALAALIGWQSLDVEVDVTALQPNDPATFTNQWESISASSPEINVAVARQSLAHAKVERQQAEPIPNLQTQWSLQQDAATEHTVFGIQLGVELPIRDANNGAIKAARADTWRTHHEIEATRRSLKQRFAIVAGQIQQADQQLNIIRDELQTLAQKNLDSTQRALRLGEASYVDLLNAQRAYISLRQETLTLYQQRAIAASHLSTLLVGVVDR